MIRCYEIISFVDLDLILDFKWPAWGRLSLIHASPHSSKESLLKIYIFSIHQNVQIHKLWIILSRIGILLRTRICSVMLFKLKPFHTSQSLWLKETKINYVVELNEISYTVNYHLSIKYLYCSEPYNKFEFIITA